MSFKHLTASDFHTVPWANGLGKTIEMIRRENATGRLVWRLSMATVSEDGPFSIFPEIERNLTVLSGVGFDLLEERSGINHRANLLTPVAFAGDVPITAKNVNSPCQDFNVMTTRDLPKPRVWIENQRSDLDVVEGSQVILFALSKSVIQTDEDLITLETHELLVCQQSTILNEGSLICVALDASYPLYAKNK